MDLNVFCLAYYFYEIYSTLWKAVGREEMTSCFDVRDYPAEVRCGLKVLGKRSEQFKPFCRIPLKMCFQEVPFEFLKSYEVTKVKKSTLHCRPVKIMDILKHTY